MCGILMTVGAPAPGFNGALNLMKHRGPDAQKSKVFNKDDLTITLGHVRLSIHDLSARSEQPFLSECGKYALIFNGEIYNFEELRATYLSDSVFHTTSDTEVLLLLLIKFGTKILNNLDGMFAFCFYDIHANSILVARDQLGIKPLYYTVQNGQLSIASELKPILSLLPSKANISNQALYEFMRNSFIYEPETGFEGIFKVPSGYYAKIDLNGEVELSPQKYWCPLDSKLNKDFSVSSVAQQNLERLVGESVELQQKSDVPVGLFFSGGVDSTILLSRLSSSEDVDILSVKHSKDDVKKSGNSDDFYFATQIAKYLNKEIKAIEFSPVLDGEQFLSEVREVAIGVEELVADFTFSVSKTLSQEARNKNSVVMLSGMGADEIFGGYEKYRLLIYPGIYRALLFMAKPFLKRSKKFAKKFERLLAYFEAENFYQRYTNMLGYFNGGQVRQMFPEGVALEDKYLDKLADLAPKQKSDLRTAMLLDHRGFLQHNFTVGDKSSMAASIELRVPLATKNLMEASFSTPDKELINLRKTKMTLRNLLKGIVPKKYLERKKAGFHPPMDTVINSIGEKRLAEVWKQNRVFDVIDESVCSDLLIEHFNSPKNNTYQIFQITFLGFWYNHFFVEDHYA